MKCRYSLLLFIIMAGYAETTLAQNYRLTVIIDSVPAFTADSAALFLAGSFNNWNPQDNNFRFRKQDGHYRAELNAAPGLIEFKTTKGGWDKVETDQDGKSIANRTVRLQSDSSIHIAVRGWQDHFGKKEKMHTASKNVTIIEAFYMPQLKRSRTLRIYLPPGYTTDKKKRYPVLYLQDGQNVFDEFTSYAGEWDVDGFMDTTALPRSIVVAIDNGGDKRLDEYCPYPVKRIPHAEGNAYADFMVQTLKPYIDTHYRTLKSKPNTFIAGSSMGGLISFYTALKYPKIYGGIGVFSPSFWVTEHKIDEDVKRLGPGMQALIYFYVGLLEGDTMPNDLLRIMKELAAVSKAQLTAVIRSGGRHNEEAWRKEFPLFYQAVILKKK
ncbi:MAG TPA: alpha/beta hydrolase-fold protein [Niabella sp.]